MCEYTGFLVGVPPGSAGESNCTVFCAMTGVVGTGGVVVLLVATVGVISTTVGTILGATKLDEDKYEITDALLEVKLW